MLMQLIDFIARWAHVLFGITWIGMLYYFNFVQTEYFKEADGEALPDVKAKLAPRALWWFRWGAMFTFLTGLLLLAGVKATGGANGLIVLGAVAGTLMFLNVWLIIWPKQQIVLGMKEGDAAAAAPKAAVASRTNTLFSGPMLLGMLGSKHGMALGSGAVTAVNQQGASTTALAICLAIIALLEVNAIVGKPGPMATVRGVIHSSIILTIVLAAVLYFV